MPVTGRIFISLCLAKEQFLYWSNKLLPTYCLHLLHLPWLRKLILTLEKKRDLVVSSYCLSIFLSWKYREADQSYSFQGGKKNPRGASVRSDTDHAVDQDAERNPEEERERHHRAHDVISQELSECVDVEFIDEVPHTFHHILHLLHAFPLYRQKWLVQFRPLWLIWSLKGPQRFALCSWGFSRCLFPFGRLVVEAEEQPWGPFRSSLMSGCNSWF